MDPINEFHKNLYNYLTGDGLNYNKNTHLLKKNSEKLSLNGDVSFPIDISIWQPYLVHPECSADCNILTSRQTVADGLETEGDGVRADLTAASVEWNMQIKRVQLEKIHCNVFINRLNVFQKFINRAITENLHYGQFPKDKSNCSVCIQLIDVESVEGTNELMTDYRLKLIASDRLNASSHGPALMKNVIGQYAYDLDLVDSDHVANYSFSLTTKSTTKQTVPANSQKIICGIVLDPTNNRKMASSTAADYIQKRSTDMQLMAQHKYGLRVRNEKVFINLIDKLGRAAVTVDMLEVKHSRPVALNSSGVTSSSKGAAFILYNSARLETLLRTFDEKVNSGYYPELPGLDQVDMSLLVEEEEWQLMYNFVVGFQYLIERSVGDLPKGILNLHLLCHFLSQLTATFSVYYRRIRILTENRPQLLPVIFSRIYLLKSLQIVFNKTLGLLNIEPVKQM